MDEAPKIVFLSRAPRPVKAQESLFRCLTAVNSSQTFGVTTGNAYGRGYLVGLSTALKCRPFAVAVQRGV